MKKTLLCLLLIVMTGCSASDLFSNTPAVSSESSYADFINVGDKHYVNAWELALVDPAGIEEIGEVELGTVVPEGTSVYSLPDYPEHNVVVVKTDSKDAGMLTNVTGYLVYVRYEGDGESYYPEIEDQAVSHIQIYKAGELFRELKGEEANAFLQLFEQHGAYNEFSFEDAPQYTVLFVGDHVLGHNYGIMEKNGQFGLTHLESKLPDAIYGYFK
ncbi:hypothetical protein [Paenibacillus tengchongensis]|uniref:hypothetical protein n=1 Tax=Paenibacillus tengchongensis TaxID=2608684 RepID=UPI00124D2CB8|nr:hypothetical protein [Paenibacillus tengchongensis]